MLEYLIEVGASACCHATQAITVMHSSLPTRCGMGRKTTKSATLVMRQAERPALTTVPVANTIVEVT